MAKIAPLPKGIALKLRTMLCSYTQIRTHVKIWPIHHNKNRRECYLDNQKVPYTERHNMTEFLVGPKKGKKPWMFPKSKQHDLNLRNYILDESYKSDPVEARETANSKLKRFQDSLIQRGSARESEPYTPPDDVAERIMQISSQYITKYPPETPDSKSISIDIKRVDINSDLDLKLRIINQCITEFKHELPTSALNDIKTVEDLVNFFTTPVRGVNPYTDLVRRSNQLPQNLHIVEEPIRFNKETDTYFDGYNALPGSVLKVNGIRGSRKYPTLNQDEFQWPDV